MRHLRNAIAITLLWAYARTCHRTHTSRRLARANLLRQVSARPPRQADCGRADGRCDRTEPAGTPIGILHSFELADDLTAWQAEVLRKAFAMPLAAPTGVEIPVRRTP